MASITLQIAGDMTSEAVTDAAAIYGGWEPKIESNTSETHNCDADALHKFADAKLYLASVGIVADNVNNVAIDDNGNCIISYYIKSIVVNPVTSNDAGTKTMQKVFDEYVAKALSVAAQKKYEWSVTQ